MSELWKELLRGAKAIAREALGDDSEPSVRKVYHWVATGQISVQRKGNELITTRSRLRRDFGLTAEDQEA